MTAIANYFAVASVKVDERSLKDVDKFLKKIEDRFKKGLNSPSMGGAGKGIRVNAYVDQAKFNKHFSGVINKAINSTPITIKNIGIDPKSFKSKIQAMLGNTSIRANVSGVLTRNSLSQMRAQLIAAFANIPVGGRASPRGAPGGSPRTPGGNSGGRNGGKGSIPGFWERMMGRPDKGDLSSPNRRYYDNVLGGAFGGIPTPVGQAAGTVLGGIGRIGSKSVVGRGLEGLGSMIGGARGGAVGLVVSGITSMMGTAFSTTWKTFGTILSAPFQMISSASNMVIGAFYKLAMAALPLVGAFSLINKNVQEVTAREISLTSTAKRFGTDSETEKTWLRKMADTEGIRYSELVKPYTGFLSGYAPVAGVDASRNMFEAFTQYGKTHGATDQSFGNAYYAMQQIKFACLLVR